MKRRIGSRRGLGFLLLILTVGAVFAGKAKKPNSPASYCILAGTVFRDSGLALPGAKITVTPEPAQTKKAVSRAVSDARGEFFFRLPPGPASYNVIVQASGYQEMKKTATYSGEERYDFSFILEPEKLKK